MINKTIIEELDEIERKTNELLAIPKKCFKQEVK